MRQEKNGTPAAEANSTSRALEEYLAAAEVGTAPPREEFLARYPDLAEDLDACLGALCFIGRAAEGPRFVAAGLAQVEPPEQTPGQLGDFRLIREVGRGGMGVVYEAEQISLGRRVALKVLPFAATLDPRQLQRFHNEVRAAASLDHPHIVHVHAVGCERAVHFYAMQFIEGQTLAQMIADLRVRIPDAKKRPASDGEPPASPPDNSPPTKTYTEGVCQSAIGNLQSAVVPTAPVAAVSTQRGPLDRTYFRRVAELGIQAAEALDHAHALGIVHRDVKPANFLVDASGNLWVTDFGLAQVQSDARLTMTGDLVGTLRYMSPEQALAKRVVVDHRADVYALGATLYELLTLRPAFDGNDRQELLRQIAFELPRPPRRVDRKIPAELETVVLKALEKNPDDRYATAKDLADDLRRFGAGEPIRVRPPGAVERAYKWARRKPTLAAAYGLSITVLLLLGFAASLAALWRSAAVARDSADIARGAAEDAQQGEGRARTAADQARKEAEQEREKFARFEYGRSMQVAYQEWREHNAPAALNLLESTRPDLRGWEWRYVHRLCHTELVALNGHSRDVRSGSFSPDGTRILSGSLDNTVRVWDAKTGVELVTLKSQVGHFGPRPLFSPDGSRVLTLGDETPRVWDAKTGAELLALMGHTAGVMSASFSPDGSRVVTVSQDKTARVWDAKSGAEVFTLSGHAGGVHSASFSPDGGRVLTGGTDRTARVWDARSGAEVLALKGHAGGVNSAVFSPDGVRVLTVGDDKTARVWDARTGVELLALKAHTGDFTSASFNPDGSRVLTTGHPTPRVWDARSGAELFALKGHTGPFPVDSATFSPDGSRILTAGGNDYTARVWDAKTGTELLTLKGHPGRVWSATFSPDGSRIVTGGSDGTARVWDARPKAEPLIFRSSAPTNSAIFSPDGTRILTRNQYDTRVYDAKTGAELLRSSAPIKSAAFSPDGTRIVTESGDNTVRVWNAKTGAQLLTLKGDAGQSVSSPSFSPDGSRILTAGGNDYTARVWDAKTGAQLLALKGHGGIIYSAWFNPDGSRVLTTAYPGPQVWDARNWDVRMWDTRTGAELFALKGRNAHPSEGSATFSPDGTRVVITWGHTARLWDAKTGAELFAFSKQTAGGMSLSFSPDGARVVTGHDDQAARVWDSRTGVELFTLRGATRCSLRSWSFNPDGSRVVTTWGDGTVTLWDAKTGAKVLTLKGNPDPANSASFSPDGSRVLTTHDDRTARVWDVRSGAEVLTLKGHTHFVVSASFSPDGSRILTASWDHTARVWDATEKADVVALRAEPGGGSPAENQIFHGRKIVSDLLGVRSRQLLDQLYRKAQKMWQQLRQDGGQLFVGGWSPTLLGQAAASVEAENPKHEPSLYSVRLADGSQVNLQLLTEEINILTAYGKLKVPVADVRRIDVGLRYPEGVEKRVEEAVGRLGDVNSKVREAAGKELLQLKELAYPALKRAVQNKDPGIRRRATDLVRELADELSADQLDLQEHDVIVTSRFPITGRIDGLALRVHSRAFGDGQLRLADTRHVRSLAAESAAVPEQPERLRTVAPRRRTIRQPDPGVYEVRLADGSLIDVRVLSKEIELTTRGGKVKVPAGDVRRIDVGFRYPEGAEQRVEGAVARLGDPDFNIREAAEKELHRLKGLAYPALKRAVGSKDAEVKRRATDLVRKLEYELPGELLRVPDEDTIVTSRSQIAGRIEGTLRVHSHVLGEGQLRLADTRELRSLTAEVVTARALLERVRQSVQAKRTTQSQKMGSGQEAYEEVPKGGALLIGFEVTYGKFGASPTVTTLRPIFLTRTGRVLGTTHGTPGEGLIRVEAKPGYAVGGVTIKAGLGVDGMSVTFMEIREGGLDPNRSYESEWLGGMGGGPKTKVADSGAPVVGIFGAVAEGTSTFNGLGLVTAPVPE